MTAPPPPLGDTMVLNPHELKMQQLQALAQKFEINLEWVSRLRQLEGFNICLLLDDSGSMSTPCAPGGSVQVSSNPYAPRPTRWDELRNTVSILLQIVTALDQTGHGIDIFFLNRPPLYNVSDPGQVHAAFVAPPSGFTPLSKAFNFILQAKAAVMAVSWTSRHPPYTTLSQPH